MALCLNKSMLAQSPNIDGCAMGKEIQRGPEVSHCSNSNEMHQLYHTEEILSCVCVVWMVSLVL